MDIQTIRQAVENNFVFDKPGQAVFSERDAIQFLLGKVGEQEGRGRVDEGPELVPRVDRRYRDEFLALAMDGDYQDNYWFCRRCDDVKDPAQVDDNSTCKDCGYLAEWCAFYDFSEWELFGRLLMWSKRQDWWCDFVGQYIFFGPEHAATFAFGVARTIDLFEPNHLADAVFSFLKKKKGEPSLVSKK